MATIIKIKKNKPAFRALIRMAKELEKSDHDSISIVVENNEKKDLELITPIRTAEETLGLFELLQDFPSIDQIRAKAWPGI